MTTSAGWVIAAPRGRHGLGNRIRVVLGAKSLSEVAERSFGYVWPTGRSFGARLTDLWEFPERRVTEVGSRALALRHPYRDSTLQWLTEARTDRVWQIRTAHALALPPGARPWGEVLQGLRPAAPVADRITSFWRRHLQGEPYVGVMVRSHPHSHAETLARSPVSWFIDRMSEISADRPDVRFFVSTDLPDVQRQLLHRFPTAVGLDDKGPYNSAAALRSAVVDLYLLASARHVLAPHYSSFPELSQALAGRSLRLETSATAMDVRLGAQEGMAAVADPLDPHLRIGGPLG